MYLPKCVQHRRKVGCEHIASGVAFRSICFVQLLPASYLQRLLQTVKMTWYRAASLLLVLMVVPVRAVPLIHTPWGALQGISVKGDGGRMMNAYLGIPYALPPVGDLRFEKPQPHPGPREGEVFMADQVKPACKQPKALIGESRETSEDCLILDIYVPADEKADGPYAVMIFIHGGGFAVGDAHSYRPSKLVVDGRVIVVAIQYRLGPYGFFTTGDGLVPGNAGLWDQNLAIRWVKDNIQAFGGDPSRITIFGESAGSMSVGLHMLSPQSKGLFQRGIMQSGAPQNIVHWIDMFDMNAVFKDLAEMCGCQGDSSSDLLKCIKDQTEEDFFNKSSEHAAKSPFKAYYYPNIDGEFLPGKVTELLKDNQYMTDNGVNDFDIIVGLNNKEGALVLFSVVYMNMSLESMYTSAMFQGMVDSCLGLQRLNKNSVMKKTIEFFYRGADAATNVSETLEPLVDMYGDCILTTDILDWARRLAASSHSAARYVYIFDHDFAFNNQGPVPGSHHSDELVLEFDNTMEMPEDFFFKKLNKTGIAPEEQPLSDKYIQILTSFAKTGNPNPPLKDDLGGEGWPRFTQEKEAYLSLSMYPRVVPNLAAYRDRMALWLSLLPELSNMTSKLPPEDSPKEESAPKEEL
ncbi:carboxylesterase 1C-like isoform X2 [Babylonia areolata]|uniref:carboxylesterase 1C-like isoform X2 n=1 Tax=Babylonia areolata TaxID=304850 RepID=UPI003FD39C38